MGDEWRKKKYYRTRVNIDLADILALPSDCVLIPLPRDGVSVLRTLMKYAHYRATWVSQYIDSKYYLGPDTAEWDTIEELNANIERGLMMTCDMQDLIDKWEEIRLELEGIKACVCSASSSATTQAPPAVIDAGKEYAPDLATEIAVRNEAVPTVDSEKCDLANVVYGFAYEFITEQLIPLATNAIDATTIAITLTSAFAVLSGGLGLPLAIAAGLFSAVVNYLADMATSNLENWLFGNAQEIVCALYEGFLAGSYTTAANNVDALIEASGLPFGDKIMLKLLLTAEYYMQGIKHQVDAQLLDPADYINYTCDVCAPANDFYWEGLGCPDNDFTGSTCRDDGDGSYPAVHVGATAQTDVPDVGNTTEHTGVQWTIRAAPRSGIGGNFTVNWIRQDTQQSWANDTFSLGGADPSTDFVFNTGIPPTEVYCKVSPSGASACRIEHIKANWT